MLVPLPKKDNHPKSYLYPAPTTDTCTPSPREQCQNRGMLPRGVLDKRRKSEPNHGSKNKEYHSCFGRIFLAQPATEHLHEALDFGKPHVQTSPSLPPWHGVVTATSCTVECLGKHQSSHNHKQVPLSGWSTLAQPILCPGPTGSCLVQAIDLQVRLN